MNMLLGSTKLKGIDYFFNAGSIKAGAINWGVLTVYLILFIPNYAGNLVRLGWFIGVILVSFVVTMGCVISAARGSKWKKSGTSAEIALASSPFITTVIAILIFIVFDSNIIFH
jgi:hypothetical protein